MKIVKLVFCLSHVFLFFTCSDENSLTINEPEIEIIDESTVLDLIRDRVYSSSYIEEIFSKQRVGDVELKNEELPLETQIANQILFEIEQEAPFIEGFLNGYGIPYWQYAYINLNSNIFNVAIPIIQGDEITSVFSFLQADEETMTIHFNSVEFNSIISPYSSSFTTGYIYHVFEELTILSGKELLGKDLVKNECCGGLTVPTYASLSGNSWSFSLNQGSLCTCYDWFNNTLEGGGNNGLVNISCCDEGTTGNQLDGGHYEAGIDGTNPNDFGSVNNWITYYTSWLNYWRNIVANDGTIDGGSISVGVPPRANVNQNNVQILTFIQNEQKLLGWLTRNLLETTFGVPAPIEYVNFLGDNPHISGEIYKYLKGFYENVTVVTQNATDLLEIMISHPFLDLSEQEVQHILTSNPNLIGLIESLLDIHSDDLVAFQVIHDFISFEYCDVQPHLCNDYPSDLIAIYSLYEAFSEEQYDWLHSTGVVTIIGGSNRPDRIHEYILEFYLLNTELSESEKISNIISLIDDYINCLENQDLDACTSAIIPYSCESFTFEDWGLFKIARLEGVEMNFLNGTTGGLALCDFNVQLSAPPEARIGNAVTASIPDGLLQNAAAGALNSAVSNTVAYFGPNYNYNQSNCPEYIDQFSDFFVSDFQFELEARIASHYSRPIEDISFDVEPEAHAGYSGSVNVSPTQKVGDLTMLLGLALDNCLE